MNKAQTRRTGADSEKRCRLGDGTDSGKLQTRRRHRLRVGERAQTRRIGADSEKWSRLEEEAQTWRKGADSEMAQRWRRLGV